MRYYILKDNHWVSCNKLYFDLYIGEKKIGKRLRRSKRYDCPKTMRLFTRILVRKERGTNLEND